MTKHEADVAGTLGVLVVRSESERPHDLKERYRILYLSKRYPEQYERDRGKRAENRVTLVDGMHRCVETALDQIEAADPVEFAAMLAAYDAGKTPPTPSDDAPKKQARPSEKKTFKSPTVGEVAAYAVDKLLDVDAAAFVDHYEACGWVVGKNKPMRDWKAAVRQWARRNGEFSGAARAAAEKPQSSFDTDEFWTHAVRRSYGEDLAAEIESQERK